MKPPVDRVPAIERAILALKRARDDLALADCRQTLLKVRSALKSAEGAKRHAEGMQSRYALGDARRLA